MMKNTNINIGDRVEGKRNAPDSFFKKFRGTVKSLKPKGRVVVDVDEAIDKWSTDWEGGFICSLSEDLNKVKKIS